MRNLPKKLWAVVIDNVDEEDDDIFDTDNLLFYITKQEALEVTDNGNTVLEFNLADTYRATTKTTLTKEKK